jgi:hypothetical protein
MSEFKKKSILSGFTCTPKKDRINLIGTGKLIWG